MHCDLHIKLKFPLRLDFIVHFLEFGQGISSNLVWKVRKFESWKVVYTMEKRHTCIFHETAQNRADEIENFKVDQICPILNLSCTVPFFKPRIPTFPNVWFKKWMGALLMYCKMHYLYQFLMRMWKMLPVLLSLRLGKLCLLSIWPYMLCLSKF